MVATTMRTNGSRSSIASGRKTIRSTSTAATTSSKPCAANNADCLFTTVPPKLEDLQQKLKFFRDAAPPGQLRNIFASCHLMVRRTRKEAEDYHHYIVYEQGDWESAEYAF